MECRKYLLILTLALLCVVSISAVSSAEFNDEVVTGLNSTSDINQGLDAAHSLNKSVLLIFDQDSCYYCDLLKEDVLSNRDVQDILNENYIVVFVDINEQYDLAADFQVMGTPTCVILDSDGNNVSRIDGYVSGDEFLDAVKEI